MTAPTTLPALRALALPHTSPHARDVLLRCWDLASQARAIRDGDPLGTRTPREAHADRALAYTMACELYPHSAEKYARWAAGWAALDSWRWTDGDTTLGWPMALATMERRARRDGAA